MNSKIFVLGGILGVLAGYFIGASRTQDGLPIDSDFKYNDYGVLVIPILNSCHVNVDDYESNFIDKIEIINFDKRIRGLNSSEYMVIEHEGGPARVLNFIHEKMKFCIPDSETVFNSEQTLTNALRVAIEGSDVYRMSSVYPIYISIENGVIKMVYKSEEN